LFVALVSILPFIQRRIYLLIWASDAQQEEEQDEAEGAPNQHEALEAQQEEKEDEAEDAPNLHEALETQQEEKEDEAIEAQKEKAKE